MFTPCPRPPDSASPTPSATSAGANLASTVFDIGKFKGKGKTFEDIANEESGYCEWALRLETCSGLLQTFREFLLTRRGQPRPSSSSVSSPFPGEPSWMAPRSAAAPLALPGVGSGPGPRHGAAFRRLGEDELFVCELLPDQHFMVRAERMASQPSFSWANTGGGQAGTNVYLPSEIWHTVGGLPGAKMTSNRRAWAFPLANHDLVVDSLQRIGNVERIPLWLLAATQNQVKDSRELNHERLPPRLLEYQLEGVQFGLARGGRCLIGDEMGLGKTLQALALAAQYMEEWPVLVLCPSSLRWVWKDQAQEWLQVREHEVQVVRKVAEPLQPRAKFWVLSYNMLATDMKHGSRFATRPDGSPHQIVIADESHNIKDWGAIRTKALVPILQKARRAILLSGTPTRNSADELHPQMCGLMPQWRMSPKFEEFRARYCQQRAQQTFGGKTVTKVCGARNPSELNHLLTSTVMVRRMKKDVLTQLPPKRRQKIPMDTGDSMTMKEVRKEMQRMKLRTGVGVSQSLLRTGDGRLDDFGSVAEMLEEGGGGSQVSSLFLKMAQAKLPAVREYITEVLDRAEEKAIIFAHHQLVLDEISDLLYKHLPKHGLTFVRIDGRTAADKRAESVKTFQETETCRIALLSITACGEGLTLTAAGLVIFAELYWVPGAIEQAEARAHRIGSTHNRIVVEFLVVPNSPDEYIYNSLERKKKDTSHVLNGAAESLDIAAKARKRGADSDSEDVPCDVKGASAAGSASGNVIDRDKRRSEPAEPERADAKKRKEDEQALPKPGAPRPLQPQPELPRVPVTPMAQQATCSSTNTITPEKPTQDRMSATPAKKRKSQSSREPPSPALEKVIPAAAAEEANVATGDASTAEEEPGVGDTPENRTSKDVPVQEKSGRGRGKGRGRAGAKPAAETPVAEAAEAPRAADAPVQEKQGRGRGRGKGRGRGRGKTTPTEDTAQPAGAEPQAHNDEGEDLPLAALVTADSASTEAEKRSTDNFERPVSVASEESEMVGDLLANSHSSTAARESKSTGGNRTSTPTLSDADRPAAESFERPASVASEESEMVADLLVNSHSTASTPALAGSSAAESKSSGDSADSEEASWRQLLKQVLELNPNRGKGSAKNFQAIIRDAAKAAPTDLYDSIMGALKVFHANTPGPAKAQVYRVLHPDKELPKVLRRHSKYSGGADAEDGDPTLAPETRSAPSSASPAQTLHSWFKSA